MACIARNGPCWRPVGEIRDHLCSHSQLKQKSEVISTYYIFHRSAYVNNTDNTLHIQLHNSLPEGFTNLGSIPWVFKRKSLGTHQWLGQRGPFTPTDRFPPRNSCFKKTTKQLGKSNWLQTCLNSNDQQLEISDKCPTYFWNDLFYTKRRPDSFPIPWNPKKNICYPPWN